MPLDPAMQLVLDQINAWPQVPVEQMTAAVIRSRPPLSDPEVEVSRVEDVRLSLVGRTIDARLYVPTSAGEAPRPAIVFYHGGGFVYGNLDTHDSLCRVLANESACAVIAIDYRLAPEHKFPAAVDDAYDAIAYVAGAAQTFGIDPHRIAVAGDSAGGNLAAVTCLLAKERGGPKIAYQLLFYPVTGYRHDQPSMRENAQGYFLTVPMIGWFDKQYLRSADDLRNPLVSPLLAADLSGLPPALIATAQFDPLRDCGLEYAAALRSAGVPAEAVNHDGLIHGFASFHAFVPAARAAVNDAAQRVRAALYR